MKIISDIKASRQELKKVSTLTGASAMTALNVVLNSFTLAISTMLEVGFSFLPLALAGALYGPIVGGLVGAVGDTIGFFLRPNGAFFPGFTLNAFVSGVIYGFVLYRKPVTMKRSAFACAWISIVINLLLTPIWLKIMYGSAFIVIGRIIKNIIMYPINVIILYSLLKSAEKAGILKKKQASR